MLRKLSCLLQFFSLLVANHAFNHRSPVVYEISTRPWLYELSVKHNTNVDFHTKEGVEIIQDEVLTIQEKYPTDYIWLMGIWELGDYALELDYSKTWEHELEDWTKDDVIGSPFAVTGYTTNSAIGTDAQILEFKQFLNRNGIKLMLDFVPNHVAVDHPWACSNPEYLMPVDMNLLNSSDSCTDGSFSVVPPCAAETMQKFYHGGDYWNQGWTDTLQLNYWNEELRDAQIENLMHIAAMSDAVRIDMAMDVLNTHVELSWARDFKNNEKCTTGKLGAMAKKFADKPPKDEFWTTAIAKVKNQYPEYLVMAEAYNYRFTSPAVEDMTLRSLGFDFTYDVVTLKWLEGKQYKHFMSYIEGQGKRFLDHSAHFVENHDENRAAGEHMLKSPEKAMVGAVALAMLPGLKLFNHGQYQCKQKRLGVHLRRSEDEPVNFECEEMFQNLLPLLQDDIMQKGNWKIRGFYNSDALGNMYGLSDTWDNWFTTAWEWSYKNQRRLVVVNFADPGKKPANIRVLLDDIAEGDDSRMVKVHERLNGKHVHVQNSFDLREAGLVVVLPAQSAQIFDYITGDHDACA